VRLDVETPEQAQFADMTADELREDILRKMEKLGLIPMAAVEHELVPHARISESS
jgi:hypothetical protein